MLRRLKECLHQQKNVITNLWKQLTDCILDVCITNLDAPSNIHRIPEAVLLSHERAKKKYLQAGLDQRRHFSPFVGSYDRVLGNEAKLQYYCKTLQEASTRNQERPVPKLETSWSVGWALEFYEASQTSMHPRITHTHKPNKPTSPVGQWTCSTIWRTTNTSQNWTKSLNDK